MNKLNYQDYLDLRLCVKSRIMQIEDTIMPIFCKLEDDEITKMYQKELEKMNKLYNKLKDVTYENFLQ